MHQHPPKTPLFASTSPANASQLDSSSALIAYRNLTSLQPSRQARSRLAGPRPARFSPLPRSEPPMHDEQRDLAALGVAERTRHSAHSDEADPPVELDRGRVALGDRVELHRAEAGLARPPQRVLEERPAYSLTTAPGRDHVVAAGD